MQLMPDEIKNAGLLGDAWIQLRLADGDLHKLIPDSPDEMRLIACLWGHLDDVNALIEAAIRGMSEGDGDDGGDGGGDADVEERADTPHREANSWLLVPCFVCPEDGTADEYADDEEESEPPGFGMNDEDD